MAFHHHTQYSSTRNTGIIMSPGLHYRVTLQRIEVYLPLLDFCGVLATICCFTKFLAGFCCTLVLTPFSQRRELPEEEGGKCNSALRSNSYGAYDLESCHTECRDKQLNASCGCIPILPPHNIHNYTACSLKQMNECGQNAYHQFGMFGNLPARLCPTAPNKRQRGDC